GYKILSKTQWQVNCDSEFFAEYEPGIINIKHAPGTPSPKARRTRRGGFPYASLPIPDAVGRRVAAGGARHSWSAVSCFLWRKASLQESPCSHGSSASRVSAMRRRARFTS